MKRAYALIFDGYADWELGHVLPELRRFGNIEVVTVGFTKDNVVSMGGLRVIPQLTLTDINIDDVLIMILPGGPMWEDEYPAAPLETLLHRLESKHVPIAAICGATAAVARAGLIRGRKHTSNSKQFLSEAVPGYAEGDLYENTLAVRDKHLITASGLGAVDFAMGIFKELDITNAEMRTIWYEAFKHGIHPEERP